jgi:hypothetical protein
LKKLNSEITEDLSIHLIVDNYSTHKHQKVRRWLERHPRFHLHFTPTSASWMNMVERFFRKRIFKLSCDEQFEAKFWDVIGVYLDPPDNAVVLCCDEKGQCQALQRSQPGLPLGQGHFRTVTHDYYRHGTVTLFAALDYLSGKVISQVAPRHRHSGSRRSPGLVKGTITPCELVGSLRPLSRRNRKRHSRKHSGDFRATIESAHLVTMFL